MAPPGSLTARYEAVAGDENARRELYVARATLGYTVAEWRALPWWQRKMYLEGWEWANAPADDQDGAPEGSPLDAATAGFM